VSDDRIQEMRAALEPFSMRNHVGMKRVIAEGMKLPMAQEIARTYGPCNAISLQIMAAGVSRLENLELVNVLVENMYDEAGRGDAEQSHIRIFERFMRAVDVDPAGCPVEPGGLVDTYRKIFLAVGMERNEYEACGFLYGFEAVFPHICDGIHQALLRGPLNLSEHDLYFFPLHAKGDVYHSEDIFNVMTVGADTPEKWDACVRRAIYSASQIHLLFSRILSAMS
jgi:pyrroloquinoline quinone (PQQ) biosynthesis protein C